MAWLDCVIECTAKHGLENFWACMIVCSIEFPDEARRIGFLPSKPTSLSDSFTAFKGCERFLENTTDQNIKLLVTICNPDDLAMAVDIDGAIVTNVEGKTCKGVIVQIPPGKALHADRDGTWKAQSL